MVSSFGQFTPKARRVLSLAHEEARTLNHTSIRPEHLLLGLAREDGGVAARVLKDLGVDLPTARSTIEEIAGPGKRVTLGRIGLAPRTKRAIELAVEEARRLNHQAIGTEHLLLGLVREEGDVVAAILASVGVGLERVQQQTLEAIKPEARGPAPPPPEEAPPSHPALPVRSTMSQLVAFAFGLAVGVAVTAMIAIFWRDKGTL